MKTSRKIFMGLLSVIMMLTLLAIPRATAEAAFIIPMPIDVPIDIQENVGNNDSFSDGPCNVAVGDHVYYKMDINLQDVIAIAQEHPASRGYITGNFTMTVKSGAGLVPTEGQGTSSDISAYFGGGAVDLFEMTAAPAYDSATNTVTYSVKVKDKYGTDGIIGSDLVTILQKGIYAESQGSNTSTVTDDIKTAGYARTEISFTGDLIFTSASGLGADLKMTGVQNTGDGAGKKDPATPDTDTTVSATVNYVPYNVTYSFVSGTAGKELPAEVTALLPAATTADEGPFTAEQPAQTTVTTSDGVWTFNGYDADTKTIDGADIAFTGTWTYAEKQYNVTYNFVSGTSGKDLPAEVTALLPASTTANDKMTVYAVQPAQTSVAVSDGTWTFTSYDADSKAVNGADIAFTGTWTFKANAAATTTTTTTTKTAVAAAATTAAATAPQTGDSSSMTLYLSLFAVSMLGFAAVLQGYKKHQK